MTHVFLVWADGQWVNWRLCYRFRRFRFCLCFFSLLATQTLNPKVVMLSHVQHAARTSMFILFLPFMAKKTAVHIGDTKGSGCLAKGACKGDTRLYRGFRV